MTAFVLLLREFLMMEYLRFADLGFIILSHYNLTL